MQDRVRRRCHPFAALAPARPATLARRRVPALLPFSARSWDATAAPEPRLLHEHVGHIDWVRACAAAGQRS